MKKKNVIVCLVCVCFLKKVIKNTILFKEREKERIREERRKKWWAYGRKERKRKSLVLSMGPTIVNLFTKRSFNNVN